MYGIFHIRSVSVGLDSQIWYLFIYITGYLNVRKISETIDFRTFVGPLLFLYRFSIPWKITKCQKDLFGIDQNEVETLFFSILFMEVFL